MIDQTGTYHWNLGIITSFWQLYNDEESFLPLVFPLVFWIAVYQYCLLGDGDRPKFHKLVWMHNLHNNGAMFLASISLYFNNDAIFNERIVILFTISYFLVDGIDCVARRDVSYTFHAFMCLALASANYTVPACRVMRMNSQATFTELSSIFLHIAKKTRQSFHFILFANVFTLCRMLLVPYLGYQLLQVGVHKTHPALLYGLAAYYALNLYWYSKILAILIRGHEEANGKTPETIKQE